MRWIRRERFIGKLPQNQQSRTMTQISPGNPKCLPTPNKLQENRFCCLNLCPKSHFSPENAISCRKIGTAGKCRRVSGPRIKNLRESCRARGRGAIRSPKLSRISKSNLGQKVKAAPRPWRSSVHRGGFFKLEKQTTGREVCCQRRHETPQCAQQHQHQRWGRKWQNRWKKRNVGGRNGGVPTARARAKTRATIRKGKSDHCPVETGLVALCKSLLCKPVVFAQALDF